MKKKHRIKNKKAFGPLNTYKIKIFKVKNQIYD